MSLSLSMLSISPANILDLSLSICSLVSLVNNFLFNFSNLVSDISLSIFGICLRGFKVRPFGTYGIVARRCRNRTYLQTVNRPDIEFEARDAHQGHIPPTKVKKVLYRKRDKKIPPTA